MSRDNTEDAYGADYSPGIGGGGAQQKNCCGTTSGDGGSVALLGNTVLTVAGGRNAAGIGPGKRTGGWTDSNGNGSIIHKEDSATLIEAVIFN